MATTVTLAGFNYSIPAYSDTVWAQGTGNLSSYLIAIAAVTLQTTGGNFTLSADVNFGATYGLVSAYYKAYGSLLASSGTLRLGATDFITWYQTGHPTGLVLGISGTNLQWQGANVYTGMPTATEYRYTYEAGTASGTYTGSLTVVDLPAAYVANGKNLKVYINGLLYAPTLDYVETSTTKFTFNSNLTTGDRIDAIWTLIA